MKKINNAVRVVNKALSVIAFCVCFACSLSAANDLNSSPLPPTSATISAEEFQDSDILALSDELKAILDRNIRPIKRIEAKTTKLHDLLFSENYYNITYNLHKTHTANETLITKSGNCISLAVLFVASARYVGLDAYFQQVEIEQTWEKGNGHYIVPGHINARVKHPSKTIVVEFLSTYYLNTIVQKKSHKISDQEAFAQFYNNIGMESFDRGEYTRAESFLYKSLKKDKKLAFTWSNLGVVQKTMGNIADAEKAYIKAQKLDKRNSSYANNLYVLYKETGQDKKAEKIAKRVLRYNKKNPYYLAKLASADSETEDYRSAVTKLLKAIKIKPEEEEFYIALSKNYYHMGDLERTKKALVNAANIATKTDSRDRYRYKVKLIEQYVTAKSLHTSTNTSL